MTWGQAAAATRGRILSGDPSVPIRVWSIDTRTLEPGAAFVAVVGPNHDAHRFLGEAAAKGAAGVVVSDAEAARAVAERGLTVLLVDDTTRALQDAASHALATVRPQVLAITGSVGKSTTKDLTALLVEGERRTHASPGNLNNHYGLPLVLLGMPEDVEVLVLELGISTPGEMDRLIEIARPDLGLVTRIAAAHVGNFESFDALADEKMKLPAGSKRALLNADDPAQWSRRDRAAAVTPFGAAEAAADGLRLLETATNGLAGVRIVAERAGRRLEMETPLAGAHQGRNLLAAAALALEAGVSPETVVARAGRARPGRHRGEIVEVARDGGTARVVDDTYNANPAALRAVIELRAATPTEGRRILVAGDMRELGRDSLTEHRAVGEAAATAGVDVVVGVGGEGREIARAAGRCGAAAIELDDAEAAGSWLDSQLRAGDVALVKGSRAVELDRAVARLARGDGGSDAERGAA